MAVILSAILHLQIARPVPPYGGLCTFSLGRGEDIIKGKGGGILDPTGQAARAEMAQRLGRFNAQAA